jgi:hypothetical protein
MFAISASTFLFISLFGGDYFFGVVIGMFLIVLGLLGSARFHTEKEAPPPEIEEAGSLSIFAVVALGAFAVFSWILPLVKFNSATQFISLQTFYGNFSFNLSQTTVINGIPSWVPALLFVGVLIPNAEEQFFRGFWGNLSVARLPFLGGGAFVVSGAVFALFHAPALNGDPASLAVILLDGTTMTAINSVTGRLSTSILAHMGNNTLSFLLRASLLSAIGLPPFVFPALEVVTEQAVGAEVHIHAPAVRSRR